MLTSNLKELHDKDQQQLEQAMIGCQINNPAPESEQNQDDFFDQAKLQDKMQKLCMILSHDATKLTLACKPPRKPEDASKMIDEMSNTLYRIVGFYYDIPSNHGNTPTSINTFRKAYRSMVDGLLRGTISLLISFMDKSAAPTHSSPFMLSTAALWETCKSASSLPSDNQQAVANEWKLLMETLADAKNETDNMKSSADDHDNVATAAIDDDFFDDEMDLDLEVDPVVAKKCVSLVGLTQLLFQKIQKRCIFSDALMLEGEEVMELVDVMVSKAYDLDPEDMVPVMQDYVNKVDGLIQVALSASGQENDVVWFKMCATKLSTIIA
ncbi:Grap2 and cyclin-D-interacting-domain-containing protein [Absidia repens]|uniref:Grap2 and cyclin-D-interacting-domain-containing protein n=1 Tax=Absidia repens TaxID=90262 RepID=A0A1X2J2S0_9FUNG|nr:Grap2 and cyclin-D-interacting-domain-containing protein [Absidia repens]